MMRQINRLQERWSIKYCSQYFTAIGVLSVVYFVTAKLAFTILNLNIGPSPLWPSAGIALAALVLRGRRVWPGIALGAFSFARSLGVSWFVAGGIACGSALQAVIGAELLRRMKFRPSLERLQDVIQLVVFGAAASPLVNATISTLIGYWAGTVAPESWQRNLWIFWLGDWIGILVVSPLLLVISHWLWNVQWSFADIFSGRSARKGHKRSKLRNFTLITPPTSPISSRHKKIQYCLEAVICFSLLCFISWFVFGSKTGSGIAQYPLEYLAFPFVVWAALRFAQLGAIASNLIVCSFAIWGAAQGVGPFMTKAETLYQAILFLHGFIGVLTITALVLAAAGSERALAIKLLKEREASLVNAQRLAQLGNWDFFEVCPGRCLPQQQLRWSDQLYRLFGFEPKAFEPSWEAFFQVIHPTDRQRVGQAIHGALSENQPYSIEYRIIWPDGSERVVSEQCEINKCGITGTVQDITGRQQVETQLRVAAERVREAAERHRLLGEMAMRIRRSLNLDQILNTTVAEVRQFLQADRVFIAQIEAVKTDSQTSWQGSVIAESVDSFYPSLRSLIIDDETSLREWRSLLEKSCIRVIEDISAITLSPQQARYYTQYQIRSVLAVPILVGDQLYGGLVVNQCQESRQWQPWEIDWLTSLATQVAIAIQQAELYRQITELNTDLESQVEERTQELSTKMTELQELNHLKDVFLQAVSHDLRTSLLGMSMVFKNLYQSATETVTFSRSLVGRMMICNERQLSLINSLLEDHFNEERELDLQCESVQFNTLIQNLVNDYSSKLAQNQATLTYTLPAETPLIRADPQQLRRVLDNLLINALKHNPLGLNLNLQVTVENQMVRCILQDDGVGMSQQQQTSLFKLYIRGLHTEHLTGIGLGLYQCRQIITAHGGQIGVMSTPGIGSTFWFTLPLSNSTALQLQSAGI